MFGGQDLFSRLSRRSLDPTLQHDSVLQTPTFSTNSKLRLLPVKKKCLNLKGFSVVQPKFGPNFSSYTAINRRRRGLELNSNTHTHYIGGPCHCFINQILAMLCTMIYHSTWDVPLDLTYRDYTAFLLLAHTVWRKNVSTLINKNVLHQGGGILM